jgi:prepilin-type N-terminal cleavage/methylation domain-containing protein
MKHRSLVRQSGFTLVEIAIVLVIIGLLLGGVLKGQELIENGKIKNLRNDYQGIAAAYYAYKDRYNAVPGDDPGAVARWADSPIVLGGGNTLGNGNIDGGYNAGCTSNSIIENCAAWDHLRRAGLISGQVNSSNPRNAYGGAISIHTQGGGTAGASVGINICMGGLPGKAAEAMDASFDDGDSNRGQVRSTAGGLNVGPSGAAAGAASAAGYADNGIDLFTVCKVL